VLSFFALIAALPPAVPVSPADIPAKEPSVAVAGRDAAVVYAVENVLFVARSTDGGTSFGTPVRVGTAGMLSVGRHRGPRVTVDGKRLVVTAIYGGPDGPTHHGHADDGNLLAWRSADAGRTWAGPVPMADAPAAAREGLHAMAADGKGTVACAWLDLRGQGTEIWISTSSDGGKTWRRNVRAYASPGGTVCECCHPSLAYGPRGELHVMFRNSLAGARDLYLVTSHDGGATFGPATKLGTGTWPLDACPMDGGGIAVTPDGTVHTVWRRENRLYACVPGQPEREIGVGQQPWLAATAAGPVAVWEGQGGLRGTGIESLGEGTRPVVAASGQTVLATWADRTGRVWARRLEPPRSDRRVF
jgi:hypothetical protein